MRITHRDSPASMSIHEEGTISVVMPMMGVFNNLVVFDPHKPQNSLEGVVPDLATSWTWSDDGKKLSFVLRQGVKWHDGKPFTAADVKCTWDLLADKTEETFKVNFRKGWYANVEGVSVNGDHEAVFNLKNPQPAILTLLASGFTPVYPCHVSPQNMRRAPIGTGPFKFVEYAGNQVVGFPATELLVPSLTRRYQYTIIKPLDCDPSIRGRQLRYDLSYELHGPLVADVKSQMRTWSATSPYDVAANILMIRAAV